MARRSSQSSARLASFRLPRIAISGSRPQDFNALARLAVRRGFFAMKDEYQDAELQDGAWTTTRVLRGTQDKQVFSREDAGPADLRSFTAAIDALKARIAFVPQAP